MCAIYWKDGKFIDHFRILSGGRGVIEGSELSFRPPLLESLLIVRELACDLLVQRMFLQVA